MSSGRGAVVARSEAVSGVQLVDPLFTGFDEGINGGAITSCEGSEDGSVNDPFVGFGGGGGVEGGKVFQRFFEFRFGLGGVAIFLCGRGGGSIYVLSVLSVGCLVHDGRNVLGRRGVNRLRLRRRLLRLRSGRTVAVTGAAGVVAGFCERFGAGAGEAGVATAAGAAPSAWVMASMASRMREL